MVASVAAMGRVYDRLDDRQREWIARQSMFFVGTAPLAADGHVNVSPKGPIGTLKVLDDHTVAYLDIIGSGAETIAHLRENGRIVVMLCAFDGPPRILRLHGRGEAITPDDPRFDPLLEQHAFDQPEVDASRRTIVVVALERISDSCGYGVPLLSYAGERVHSDAWAQKKLRTGGEEAFAAYRAEYNARSIDGLPALDEDAVPAP